MEITNNNKIIIILINYNKLNKILIKINKVTSIQTKIKLIMYKKKVDVEKFMNVYANAY
jgi:hypothetical protein